MSLSWKQVRERGVPVLLRVALWIALTLGRRVMRGVLALIVLYFVVVLKIARRHSKAFLRRTLDHPPTLRDVWRHFHSFASVALDRVYFLADRFDYFDIEVVGLEHMTQPLSHGGLVLLVSHVGSYEVMRTMGVFEGHAPISIVMDRQIGEAFMNTIRDVNPQFDTQIIDAAVPQTSLIFRIREALEKGHVVGIMADRPGPQDRTAVIDFLGEPAHFPTTSYLIAGLLGAPIVGCSGLYLGGNQYRVEYRPIASRVEFTRSTRSEVTEKYARQFAAWLADVARANPYNWFNFYDFWQTHDHDATAHTHALHAHERARTRR